MQAIMKWKIIGQLMITCGTQGQPDPNVLQAFFKDLRASSTTKHLSLSMGTMELNSVQRTEIAKLLKAKDTLTVVVTDERITRGMVTAASWLGARISAFSWAELKDAIRHLNVVGIDEDRVHDECLNLRHLCQDELGRALKGH